MKVQFEPVNIICGIQSDIPDYQFDNPDSITKDVYKYWLKEEIVYNKKGYAQSTTKGVSLC